MQKLIDFNENQNPPLYRPSYLQELKHRSEYFEVPDLDTKVQRHDNPHYWLQRDILQIKHFQNRFFNNIILTDDTIPQVKIFTQFLLKFLRFYHRPHLIWQTTELQAGAQVFQVPNTYFQAKRLLSPVLPAKDSNKLKINENRG